MDNKTYFRIFPVILIIFTVLGLINIIKNFPNSLIAGIIIAIIPLSTSFGIISKTGPLPISKWHKTITRYIPPLGVGLIVLFLIIINSIVTLPIYLGNLPLGLINALALSLYLVSMLQYKTDNKNQIIILKTLLALFFILS